MDDLMTVVDWSRWQFALTAIYPRTVANRGCDGKPLSEDKVREMACRNKILDDPVWNKLRNRSGYRTYPRI